MRQALIATLVGAALFTSAPPSWAHHKAKASPTPLPLPAVQSGGAMGYYLMSGNRIVSPAYQTLPDCYKDLAAVKKSMAPATDTLVCVHRRP